MFSTVPQHYRAALNGWDKFLWFFSSKFPRNSLDESCDVDFHWLSKLQRLYAKEKYFHRQVANILVKIEREIVVVVIVYLLHKIFLQLFLDMKHKMTLILRFERRRRRLDKFSWITLHMDMESMEETNVKFDLMRLNMCIIEREEKKGKKNGKGKRQQPSRGQCKISRLCYASLEIINVSAVRSV